MSERRLKVMHAPELVGGNQQGLSRALRELGIESYSVALQQSQFAYDVDEVIIPIGAGVVRRELGRLRALAIYLRRPDIVHYNFGTTFAMPRVVAGTTPLKRIAKHAYMAYLSGMQQLEFALLKATDTPAFVVYQGDDARQGDYSRKNFEISIATQVDEHYYNPASDAMKRRLIDRMGRNCRKVYSVNPDLMHVLPEGAEFIPYSHVFPEEWHPVYSQTEDRPLRIVHAPSNRKVKGTDLLLSALDVLRAKGHQFELILVENLTFAEARKQYEKADVLVDQLFAGWYGGLGVELMALGKPVIVYIRQEDLKFVPPKMAEQLPWIDASPATIEATLETVLTMPRHELAELGRRSRQYAEYWHDPRRIARTVVADYASVLPASKRAMLPPEFRG